MVRKHEWYLFDVAATLDLSYSHLRHVIRELGIKPVRKIRNQPIYSTAQVKLIEARNTKPGRAKGSK